MSEQQERTTLEQRIELLERQSHRQVVWINVLAAVVVLLAVSAFFNAVVGTLPGITPMRLRADRVWARESVVVQPNNEHSASVYLHARSGGAGLTVRDPDAKPALGFHVFSTEFTEKERRLRLYNHDGELVWVAPPIDALDEHKVEIQH